MTQLTYAITGANGQVGAFLVDFLRQKGHIVYELARSQDKVKDKKFFKCFDLKNAEQPSLDGVDVLIHTAYFFDSKHKDYEIINTSGTQNIFEQAKLSGVKYLIFISTVSAHVKAVSLYGRIKYKLEQSLLQRHSNVIIVRPGLIFHEPFQGIVAAMDNLVKKLPFIPLIGNGKQLIYPCLLSEFAELIHIISKEKILTKKPVIAATEEFITFKQLVNYLAKVRQKQITTLPIPFYAIYFALKCCEVLKLPMNIRSDSLLGLQHANSHMDFSETRNLGIRFNTLKL